jgi:type I site-specific restriction endonuclease
MTTKKELSERDICSKYIQPALEKAGWNPLTQIREEVSFTDGRIYVKGNLSIRGKRKRADYILYYKSNIPIAIIEAKDNKHSVKAGIQQGLHYAEILDIPIAYSSNGDGFYEVEDRIYNRKDFDKNLVIDERTETVAKKVTQYLKKTNRFDKTIIFCVDIDHALRMRAGIANENSDLMAENSKFVMQITGDNDEGKMELDNFINPEEKYPVIATTSKLMTTGVDAQTCKLIA